MKIPKYKRLIPWITLILTVLIFMMLVNYSYFIYELNPEYYKKTTCTVDEQAYDSLTSVIPKLKVHYTFDNKYIETSVCMYNKYLFKTEIKDKHTVYVNIKSPKDFLVIFDFWDSYVNHALLACLIFCTLCLIVCIGKDIRRYVKKMEYKGQWRKRGKNIRKAKRKQKRLEKEARAQQSI